MPGNEATGLVGMSTTVIPQCTALQLEAIIMDKVWCVCVGLHLSMGLQ